MSKMAQHELQCPHCGSKQKMTIWESINVTLDPELKKKLFSGNINIFDCNICDKKTIVDSPLLYHDMQMRFCVSYYPPEILESENLNQHFKEDGTLNIPAAFLSGEAGDYMTKPHIVFSLGEMMHYVLFRDVIAQQKNS
ncbi:MAG: CpXC domain-containing protein [Armatimonas sp.]